MIVGPIDGILSVNFMNGTELLFSYISMLFSMMLKTLCEVNEKKCVLGLPGLN